jgi:hypothetical protein
MRAIHKIVIMKEFLLLFMLLISNIYPLQTNNNKPNFGKMMDEKREEIRKLRESNIEPDRRFRYSDYKYDVKE